MKNLYNKPSLSELSQGCKTIIALLALIIVCFQAEAQTPFSGTRTIGPGGNYSTITAAVGDAVTNGLNGALTLELLPAYVSSGETFPVTIGGIPGNNATNNIIIRPQAGATNLQVLGSSATSLFIVSGAQYLTIDGRAGGVGTTINLSLINTSTTGAVIQYLNDAVGNILKYTNIYGSSSATTNGAICILGTNGSRGNDSLLISNCNIRSALYPSTMANGIFAQGQSVTSQNDNITIANNNIYAFTLYGLVANSTNSGNGSYWNINGNSFYDSAATTSTSAMICINFQPASAATNPSSLNNVISGNYIGGSAPLCSGTAWALGGSAGSLTGIIAQSSASLSPTFIQNNVMQNINLSNAAGTFAFTGISTLGSGSYTIGGTGPNIIGHAFNASSIRSVNNGVLTGITNSATNIISITNNLIANLTDSNIGTTGAIRGILNSGGAIVNVNGNTVYNFYTTASSTGVTTASSLLGIGISSSGNPQNINSNIINGSLGMFNNATAATNITTGIFVGNGSFNTIQGNIVSNIRSNSTYTGTAVNASVNGINIGTSAANSIVSNNTVQYLSNTNATGNQVNGINLTTGIITAQNNIVFGLSSVSTTVSTTSTAALNGINANSASASIINGNSIDSLVYSGTAGTQVNGIFMAGGNPSTLNSNNIRRIVSTSIATSTTQPSILGINVSSTGLNITVSQNSVQSLISNAATAAATVGGIGFVNSITIPSNNSIVSRNNIRNLQLATSGVGSMMGLLIGNSNASFQNNMIRIGFDSNGTMSVGTYASKGIFVYATAPAVSGLRIYHNSLYVDGTQATGSTYTSCLEFSASIASGSADVRNNIFYNNTNNIGATSVHSAIRILTATNILSNYNMLYAPGAGGVIGTLNTTQYALLKGSGSWNHTTLLDLNSGSGNPNFISPTTAVPNLRIASPTTIEGMGDNSVSVADNFDGISRSSFTPTDIGSDAGNFTLGTDLIAPSISFTPLSNTVSLTSRTMSAVISDATGIYPSGTFAPKVYYKKGISGTYFFSSGTLSVGTVRSGQWNFIIDPTNIGAVATDSIYYYIIAQDSAGNVLSNAAYAVAADVNNVITNPVTVNWYRINAQLSGTIFVGPGNAITSLTAPDATGLFYNINTGSVSGDMNVLITGNITESGSTALNRWVEVNGSGITGTYNYTLSIRPQVAVQTVISGNVASGMIRLNGASRVTISGVSLTGNPTDTNLVFNNQNTSNCVIQIFNDANYDTLTNLIIQGRNTLTTAGGGLVWIGAAGSGSGNDNIVVNNCSIYTDNMAANYTQGISINGTAGKENDNITISNNNVFNWSNNAIYTTVGTGNGIRILNNSIFYNHPVPLTTNSVGIQLNNSTATNNDTIRGNYFGGSAPLCAGVPLSQNGPSGFTGIYCSVGGATGVVIQNNVLQNISIPSTSTSAFNLINVVAGVASIINNTIGSTTVANSIQTNNPYALQGIVYSGAASVNISGNTIANLSATNAAAATALRGIYVSATTLGVTVNANSVFNLTTGSINTGVTTASSLCGIVVSSSSASQTITNNNIYNISNTATTASVQVFGIGATAGVNNISGNQIKNFSYRGTNTGVTTSAGLIGIFSSSASAGQIISNNLVDSMYYTNATSAAVQNIGIILTGGGNHTIGNNIVRNLNSVSSSTGTGSSAGIIGISYTGAGANMNVISNTIHTLQNWNAAVTGSQVIGLYSSIASSGNNTVSKNNIHSLRLATTNASVLTGIHVNAGVATYANNMIRLGIDSSANAYVSPYIVRGIYLGTSSGNNFYHNSVYLGGNPTSGTSYTAAFEAAVGMTGTLDIRNNIFVNTVSNITALAYNYALKFASSASVNSNYNLLVANGSGGNIAAIGATNFAALTGAGSWQSNLQDLNSGSGVPQFIDPVGTATSVDLHMMTTNSVESSGDPSLLTVVDDIDGGTRSSLTPSDIGADAGNFTLAGDLFPPLVTYTPLTNTAAVGNRTFSVTITDNLGIVTSGFIPQVYYRKNPGVIGYVSSPGTLTSGNATNGTWTFTLNMGSLSGVVPGDSVQYFVVAQDNAGNIGFKQPFVVASTTTSVTGYPSTPDYYRINSALPTVINVGMGNNQTSLTAGDTSGAFYLINNGVMQGNTVINITSDLVESGTTPLNKWLETNGTTLGNYNYGLTIRPSGGQRNITGNVNAGLACNPYAMNFNGTSGYMKTNGNVPALGNTFTLEYWIKNLGITPTSSGYQRISALSGYAMETAIDNGTVVAAGTLKFYTGSWQVTSVVLPYNTWTHVAWVINGTVVTLMVNGVPSWTGSTAVSLAAQVWCFGTAFSPTEYSNVVLDEIRIWNVSRTPSAIQSTMNSCLSSSTANLVGYWNMPNGTGTTVNDASVSGNNATLTGTTNADWVSGVGSSGLGMLALNGASNVTITGIGAGGNATDTNLVITNSTTLSTPTIGILNDASNNTFNNLIIQGRSIASALANISTTTGVTGNDNIIFNNCWFRNDSATLLPSIAINSGGTGGKENDNISITNCKFNNISNTAINIGGGNGNNLKITNNHFYYNSTTPSPNTLNTINFNPSTSSNNDTISGNFIGGSTLNCGGSPFVCGTSPMNAITVSSGVLTGTFVAGNTIQNISCPNSGFAGITVSGGIAKIISNTIGHYTVPNSIQVLGNATVTGILSSTAANISISGNAIANLSLNNNGTTAALRGIVVSGGTTNTSLINNNTIDNLSTTSLNAGTTISAGLLGIALSSTSSNQTITTNAVTNLSNTNTAANSYQTYGMVVTGGANIITQNGVAGISTASNYTGTGGTSGAILGIAVTSATAGQSIMNNSVQFLTNYNAIPAATQIIGLSIPSAANVTCSGNTIQNLSSNSINSGSMTTSAIIGLYYAAGGATNTFSQNIIHSLKSMNASNVATSIIGMYYSGSTAGVNIITRNLIHSFRSSNTGPGLMNGLVYVGGVSTISNNMIRLGIDSAGISTGGQMELRGIYHTATTNNNYYHNTVWVGGLPSAGATNSFAFLSITQVAANNVLNIRNNIFYNTASNTASASGLHVAMKVLDTLRLNSNNNIFAATGTGGLLIAAAGYYNQLSGANSWNLYTGLDYNSGKATTPFFGNATGNATNVNLRLTNTNPAESVGDPTVSAIVGVDFDGGSRSSLTPSDIGAHAGTFTAGPDIFAPVISYTALGNDGNLSGPRSFTGVSIRDNSGIPLTGVTSPRVYYRKGLNGTWTSVASATNSGTSTNATFTYNLAYPAIGGVASNDTVFYYVLAQDNAGNIISNMPYAVASNVNTVSIHSANANSYQLLPVLASGSVIKVGIGQTYPTLTGGGGLFEFLNGRTIGGNLDVRITSDITEPGTVSLYQLGETGTGAGTFTVTIRPDSLTSTERVLSGNVSANAMIRLNGADRIKFSGVPAVSGVATDLKLRIRNSNINASTISFTNDATQNRLNNIIIEGASNTSTQGIIQFGSTTGSLGNSNDSITGCLIRNDISQTLPAGVAATAIYSNSTITALNNTNVISNNQIINWLNYGVYIDANNGNSWTVSGNSFYNNLPVPPAVAQVSVFFNTGILSSGNNISNNYIGGQSANCGGTPYAYNVAAGGMTGMNLNIGTANVNTVANNTIQNFSFAATSALFTGINVTFGKVNITNNVIGHPANTNSINYQNANTFTGIASSSSDVVNITGNAIQGINIASALATPMNCINVSNGIVTISGNTIGHASLANSITYHSSSTFTGITSSVPYAVSPTTTLNGNTIANINGTFNGNAIILGVNYTGTSAPVITGNMIYNINTNSTNVGTTTNMAVTGIMVNAAAPSGTNISLNNIYSLVALNAAAVNTNPSAIYVSGATTPNITRNRIYDIRNMSTSASLLPPPTANGIVVGAPGVGINIYNNQITLGNAQSTNTQFAGIWQQVTGAFTVNAIYNSVLITGTAASGSAPSYAYLRGSNSASEITSNTNLVNNILMNNRTGGSGKHYAIANQVAGAPTGSGWGSTGSNYNLFASANTATIGLWGTTDMDINNWRATSLSDNNSWSIQSGTGAGQLNANNLFSTANIAVGNLAVNNTNSEAWYINGKGVAGNSSANINVDFAANVRGTTYGFGTDIGSNEITTATVPPLATVQGTIGAGQTQTFSFAGRTLATITWNTTTGTFPTAVSLAYYSGTTAPNLIAGKNQMNAYWNFIATAGSNFNYSAAINYDAALTGNVSSESNLSMATYRTATPGWVLQSASSVNTANKIIISGAAGSITGLANWNFTGTDITNPLPVELFNFAAEVSNNKDVTVAWNTATEINSDYFEVQRSVDGFTFETVGKISAKGNSSEINIYNYLDANAFLISKSNQLFYRLKMNDNDGKYEYSIVIKVELNNITNTTVTVYPNPFVTTASVRINTAEQAVSFIRIYDLQGRAVGTSVHQLVKGSNIIPLDIIKSETAGVYFIQVNINGELFSSKLVKE